MTSDVTIVTKLRPHSNKQKIMCIKSINILEYTQNQKYTPNTNKLNSTRTTNYYLYYIHKYNNGRFLGRSNRSKQNSL